MAVVGRRPDDDSFAKPALAYDRFVGRYSQELASRLVGWVGVEPHWTVLDVGCGPGALATVLAEVVGPARVAAVDPSESFAGACRVRLPDADVRVASADALPFSDSAFDATLSQLVVNFLPDTATSLEEMRRVTKPGGKVAAAVWDYAGEMTMLRAFWDAAMEVDPRGAAPLDEGARFGDCNPDALSKLWEAAGFDDVGTAALEVSARYESFDDLWQPFTTGVGPAGAYCAALASEERAALSAAYERRLGSPRGAFALSARAWTVIGRRP
jgi:SAM-dependent methyltransferase